MVRRKEVRSGEERRRERGLVTEIAQRGGNHRREEIKGHVLGEPKGNQVKAVKHN